MLTLRGLERIERERTRRDAVRRRCASEMLGDELDEACMFPLLKIFTLCIFREKSE